MQIAIDGPSGAGKSTVSRTVAKKLNYVYIDTGAMYRALTWAAMQANIDPDDAGALTDLAQSIVISFVRDFVTETQSVFCDGVDVTEAIRTPEVDRRVSMVSSHSGVRQTMVKLQQRLAEGKNVVMDGRDVATAILPNAECKIFLTASIHERAKRRFLELTQKGVELEFDQVIKDMENRDHFDSNREISPLTQDSDAVLLDCSLLDFDATVAAVLKICLQKGAK